MIDQVMRLKRINLNDKWTSGELYGPQGDFWCYTLEDVCRKVKVDGQTAIPSGTYEVIVGWSNRFQSQMPRVCGVPFYQGILIHKGNGPTNTEGCILVGKSLGEEPYPLRESQLAFEKVFPNIRKLVEKGKLYLQIDGGFAPADWGKSIS